MQHENLNRLLTHGQDSMTVEQIADAFKEAHVLIARCKKLEAALIDIRDWDDELEDQYDDPGYRAIEALKENT